MIYQHLKIKKKKKKLREKLTEIKKYFIKALGRETFRVPSALRATCHAFSVLYHWSEWKVVTNPKQPLHPSCSFSISTWKMGVAGTPGKQPSSPYPRIHAGKCSCTLAFSVVVKTFKKTQHFPLFIVYLGLREQVKKQEVSVWDLL